MSNQETDSLTGQIRQFVIAGHGDLNRVKQMLADNPELLNAGYKWTDNDTETAVQAAAQVGNKPIAEFLLEKGAPLHICTAAMLGRRDEVERRIKLDPTQAKATGAHGIPLLAHAAFSGDLALVQFVFNNGATSGANLALQNAIMREDVETVKWLLDNVQLDLNAKNFQGKTPIQMAVERKNEKIAQLLTERGASR
jgi:ankyrin repeat protein